MSVLVLLIACRPLPPRAPTPVVIAPTFTPRPVRILQPDIAGAILFAEDIALLEEATAEFLAERGYAVLSRSAQDAALAARTCGPPTSPSKVLEHHFPEHALASLHADCDDGCSLALRVADDRWQALLPSSATVGAVLAAIPSLDLLIGGEDTDPVAHPSADDRASLGRARGVELQPLQLTESWTAAELEVSLSAVRFDTCWSEGSWDARGNPIHVAVDAAGTLRRCASAWSHQLPAAETDCVCAALETVDFGSGADDRRVRLMLRSHQPPAVNAGGQIITASLRTIVSDIDGVLWAQSGTSPHALATCLAQTPLVESADVALRYTVRADGIPAAAEADWPVWLSDQSVSCLDAALLAARFSCPVDEADGTVTATVRIEVR